MSVRDSILGHKTTVQIELKDGTRVWATLIPHELAVELAKKLSESTDETAIDALISWIIASVVEEDGSTSFQESDRQTLRQQDTPFIVALGNAIVKANTPTRAEAEKNS